MSQRNPLNDRYQQREGGKTRKSAASAKPATKAASSVYIADPNAKPKKSFFDRFKGKQEPEKKSSKSSVQAAEATEQPKKKGGKWTLNDMEGPRPWNPWKVFQRRPRKLPVRSTSILVRANTRDGACSGGSSSSAVSARSFRRSCC